MSTETRRKKMPRKPELTIRKNGLREPELAITKLATGIDGFDIISSGGLPAGQTTLVAGTSGTGKTTFALEFLWRGIVEMDEPAVLVTFEEEAAQIERNAAGFGWDFPRARKQKRFAIVDASPIRDSEEILGSYDFSALLARIQHSVKEIGAKRVALDSLSALFLRYGDPALVRVELLRVARELRTMGVTSIITVERPEEYGPIAQYGVEEFASDNVVILRNVHKDQKRHRTIEVLKFRGTSHQRGEFPYTISTLGIHVMPLTAVTLTHSAPETRIDCGVPELNEMLGGGFFDQAIVVVSGATGTGKTLTVTSFVDSVCRSGERAMMFGYEESDAQIMRNATRWGKNLGKWKKKGLLETICNYPEAMGLEDHLLLIKQSIDRFKPKVVTIDSLSALERMSESRVFTEFVIGLTNELKERGITTLLTHNTSALSGADSATKMSAISDIVLLLRYAEVYGDLRRGVAVLKMRGSWHDKAIREFEIDETGMHIGETLQHVEGIILGTPRTVARSGEQD